MRKNSNARIARDLLRTVVIYCDTRENVKSREKRFLRAARIETNQRSLNCLIKLVFMSPKWIGTTPISAFTISKLSK